MSQTSTPAPAPGPNSTSLAQGAIYERDPLGVAILVAVVGGITWVTSFNFALYHLDQLKEDSAWAGVVVGGVQCLLLLGQLIIFFRQQRAMEKQANLATVQTDLMNSQTAAISKQATLTHQDYILTHHPTMRLRDIEMLQPVAANSTLDMKLWIKNVGSTNAKVANVKADIYLRAIANRNENSWTMRTVPIPNSLVVPGYALIVSLSGFLHINPSMLQQIINNISELFLIANVFYTDETDTNHETNIIRKYDLSAKRFVRLPPTDPHYEFEFED